MKLLKSLKYTSFAAVFLACPLAAAQTELGRAGQFAVGAERLTGLVRSTVETEGDGGETLTDSSTNLHLLIHPAGNTVDGVSGGYSFPRIAGDYFVIDRLSIGAALGYFSVATTSEVEVGGTSTEIGDATVSGFTLAPRVGYAFMFSDMIGIWPRAGITYTHAGFTDNEDDDEISANMWALSLDVPFVIAPVPHVGFLVGPTLDYGFTGGATTTDGATGMETDVDVTVTEFGVQAGVVVYF